MDGMSLHHHHLQSAWWINQVMAKSRKHLQPLVGWISWFVPDFPGKNKILLHKILYTKVCFKVSMQSLILIDLCKPRVNTSDIHAQHGTVWSSLHELHKTSELYRNLNAWGFVVNHCPGLRHQLEDALLMYSSVKVWVKISESHEAQYYW